MAIPFWPGSVTQFRSTQEGFAWILSTKTQPVNARIIPITPALVSINGATAGSSTVTTLSVGISIPPQVGNLLICAISQCLPSAGGTFNTITSPGNLDDDIHLSWQFACALTQGSGSTGARVEIWYAYVATTGTTTVSISSLTHAVLLGMQVTEYSGLPYGIQPCNIATRGGPGNATWSASIPVATRNTNAFVFVAYASKEPIGSVGSSSTAPMCFILPSVNGSGTTPGLYSQFSPNLLFGNSATVNAFSGGVNDAYASGTVQFSLTPIKGVVRPGIWPGAGPFAAARLLPTIEGFPVAGVSGTTQTQTIISRLTATTLQTQSVIASLQGTTQQTQSIISRLSKVSTQTQTIISRLTSQTTQTQTIISRLTSKSTQTQTIISRLSSTALKTQTIISRLSSATQQTQTIISRLTSKSTQTQSIISRLTTTTLKTQTIISRLSSTTLQTQGVLANLWTGEGLKKYQIWPGDGPGLTFRPTNPGMPTPSTTTTQIQTINAYIVPSTPSYVSDAQATSGASTVNTLTVNIAPQAGNILILAISQGAAATTNVIVSGNISTGGISTVWQLANQKASANLTATCADIWFCPNIPAGITSVTVSGLGHNVFLTLHAVEFAGVAKVNPLNVTGVNALPNGSSLVVQTDPYPVRSNDLIISVFTSKYDSFSETFTAPAAKWVKILPDQGAITTAALTTCCCLGMWPASPAASAQNQLNSIAWAGVIASFSLQTPYGVERSRRWPGSTPPGLFGRVTTQGSTSELITSQTQTINAFLLPQIATKRPGIWPGSGPWMPQRFLPTDEAYTTASTTIRTQTIVSRLTATTLKTQTIVSRLTSTTLQTQTIISRLTSQTTKTQGVLANLWSGTGLSKYSIWPGDGPGITFRHTDQGDTKFITNVKTQTIISRLSSTTQQTQGVLANLWSGSGLTRTKIWPGRAPWLQVRPTTQGATKFIVNVKTQTIISRLSATTLQAQTIISRLTAKTLQTQTIVSRLTATTLQTQTIISRLTSQTTKTQSIVANLWSGEGTRRVQYFPGDAPFVFFKSSIQGDTVNVVRTQTQTIVSRLTSQTTRTQTVTSRLTATTLRTQTVISRLSKVSTQTQTIISRLTSQTTQTQTITSCLTATTLQTQTIISRLSKVSTQTQGVLANLWTGEGLTRAKIWPGLSPWLQVRPTIQGDTKFIVNVKTQTIISRLSATTQQAQTIISRLTAKTLQTQTIVSRLTSTTTKTQTIISRLSSTTQQTQGVLANLWTGEGLKKYSIWPGKSPWMQVRPTIQGNTTIIRTQQTQSVAAYLWTGEGLKKYSIWPGRSPWTQVRPTIQGDTKFVKTQQTQGVLANLWSGEGLKKYSIWPGDGPGLTFRHTDQGDTKFTTNVKTQTITSRLTSTTLKTQTVISRLTSKSAQTQTVIACLYVTTQQTQGVLANLWAGEGLKKYSIWPGDGPGLTFRHTDQGDTKFIINVKTQLVTARLTSTTLKTQTIISRLTATTLQTQTIISRLSSATQQTQTIISRLTSKSTQTQTIISRLSAKSTQTQTIVSRLTSKSTQTQIIISRLTSKSIQTQTIIARLSITSTQTQPIVSRLTSATTQTQTIVSRLTSKSTQTQTVISRLSITSTQTQGVLANLWSGSGIVRPGTWPGAGPGVRFFPTRQGTQAVVITSQTQTIVSRLTSKSTQTQTIISRLSAKSTQTQTIISRLTSKSTQTQTIISRLTSKSTKTQTIVSRLTSKSTQTQTIKARLIPPVSCSNCDPVYKTVLFGYPFFTMANILELRNPDLGDTMTQDANVQVKNMMSGPFRTRINTNDKLTLELKFSELSRVKALETIDFFTASMGSVIAYRDYDGFWWRGQITNTPNSVLTTSRGSGTSSRKESCSVSIEFEGIRQ